MASFLKLIHAICDITKIGKEELNGCHWLKIWLSDVSATTVAFFSKRWMDLHFPSFAEEGNSSGRNVR